MSTSIMPATSAKLEFIPTQLGFDLLADPGDYVSKLLLRDEVYEAPETDLITRIVRGGDTCIDAGCHIGYYSCLLSKLVGENGHVYSFDANPQACVNARRNLGLNGFSRAEVIHAALVDIEGQLPFHISTDDQTGLSSLGIIPSSRETIYVPCLRLGTFINDRQIDAVRLLKIDVEGAEEMLLKGLGASLKAHTVDYVLIECFDERLKLLDTSTESIATILQSAGYKAWEYGIGTRTGWSLATEVHSRGDCNYLFASPSVATELSPVSLVAAFQRTQVQRSEALSKVDVLARNVEKLQGDIDWVLESIKAHERQSADLAAAKRHLERVLGQIQRSASWRMLNRWRRLRNWLAPERSWHRRLYDWMLGLLRAHE